MEQKKRKFNVALTEAVHEGLSSVSPSITSLVFSVLLKDGSIKSNNRIDDLEAFDESLRKIFGSGAKVVEKKILEALYVKLQIPREIKGDFKFAEEVKNALKLLDSNGLVISETH